MGFYFRKSINFGGLRVNFSQSGIEFSAGIKGFRIGTGPKGNYIHMDLNGFSYKNFFSNNPKRNTSKKQNHSNPYHETSYKFNNLEGNNIQNLVNSNHNMLIREINEKNKKIRLTFIWSLISFCFTLINPIFFFFLFLTPLFIFMDNKRKTILIIYDIEKEIEEKIQAFYNTFNKIINSSSKWHIPLSANLYNDYDKKINAGASNLIKRNPCSVEISTPPLIKTNVEIPVISAGNQKLYFMPDKILIYQNNLVNCADYNELKIKYHNISFVEDETVPNDTRIIGKTWKYVNKNGNPDKRFKNNKQLPIVEYSEIIFSNNNGLNIVIQISRPDIGYEIENSLNNF